MSERGRAGRTEPDGGIPAAPRPGFGWSGGAALGLGIVCFLLTMLPAFGLFRLALEINGWTSEAVWLGPGWAAGLVLGIVLVAVGVRSGHPKAGSWGFLAMFVLWVAPWLLAALGMSGP